MTPIPLPHPDFRERLGYRGTLLVWFGALYIFVGLAVIFDPSDPIPNVPHTWMPKGFRLALWAAAGGLAFLAGLLAMKRPQLQPPAFALLVIPAAERCLSFGYAAYADPGVRLYPGWPELPAGNRAASCAVYALIVVGLLLFARWPEHTQPASLIELEELSE